MQVIKHQNEVGVAEIIKNAPKVDEASADMIADVANVKFEKVIDEKGEMDMCKGMEEYTLRTRVLSIIDYLKMKNTPVDEIIDEVVKTFDVTEEYVKSLMEAKPA